MEFHVIIPARYESKRLPKKLLLDIAGKPMLQHVYENSVASGAESVVIATDDERISEVAEKFGAKVCMTSSDHQSGTERLSEAVDAMDYDEDEIVVCVQGDEPLLPADMIRMLAQDLDTHDNVKVTSICEPIKNPDELFDPNAVKVVLNRRNYAMYFSRAPIPWEINSFENRNNIQMTGNHFRHVGIYAYRVDFLKDYMEWSTSPLESLESLEQLRILWNGGRIHMTISKKEIPQGVDTKEDLERVRALLKK